MLRTKNTYKIYLMLQLHIPCSYLLHTGFISNYCTQLSFDAPTCFGHVL